MYFSVLFFISLQITIQENYTALHLAVEAGKHSVVETLLGQGAQVHIQGNKLKLLRNNSIQIRI